MYIIVYQLRIYLFRSMDIPFIFEHKLNINYYLFNIGLIYFFLR